jgi:hypothetical protein
VVFAFPRPHQHKKLAKEGSASCHSHVRLTEMNKDGHLEDGVGREVLELEPELLQQQQEERRNWQRQSTEEIGDEEHKLPGGKIAEGNSAGLDPPGERRRAPSEHTTHRVERLLGLVVIRANQHGHGNHDGEKLRSTNAERRGRLGDERAEQLRKNVKDCARYPFYKKLPLHAKDTQISDVGAQEECPSSTHLWLQVRYSLCPWAHMSGLSTFVHAPLRL